MHARSALLVSLLAAGHVEAQAASPLPPVVRCTGPAFGELAADVANVDWEEVGVGDLARLTGRVALRRLQINPLGDGVGEWQQVTIEQLRPLTTLPQLRELTLPFCCRLSVEHLRALAACPQLSSLQLLTEALTLHADAAAALATWPALRELQLSHLEVTTPGLVGLAAAPALRRLVLQGCRGLDASGVAAVAAMPRLQSLVLERLGLPDLMARFAGRNVEPSWALEVAAMRRLAAMPELRELRLAGCVLDAAVLRELPPALTSLALEDPQCDAAALREVRRLGGLRHLTLRLPGRPDSEAAAIAADEAAAADVLGALRLESLCWRGAMRPDVAQAIATQANLVELDCPCADDLAFVAGLPRLRRLRLAARPAEQRADGSWAEVPPTPAAFAPLRGCRALAEVVYPGPLTAAEFAALRQALGERITLRQND